MKKVLMKKKPLRFNKIALAGLVVLAVIAGAVIFQKMSKSGEDHYIPESLVEYLLWEPQPLSAFTLMDFDEQEYNVHRLEGKWTFIFFGYTFCPDVCPVTMANLASVFRKMEAQSISLTDIQVLFVSVDPERDTPKVLKQYVPYFNPRFMGATGSKSQLDLFTRQLGALYTIDEPSDENYTVSHNSSLFLIDPQMRLYARFAMPHIPDEITDAYLRIVQHYDSVQPASGHWLNIP
jgi:protein SCO1